MKDIRLVVVSGPSGSGKSIGHKGPEDLGFFCVDNLPVALCRRSWSFGPHRGDIQGRGVIDVREGEF